MFVAIYAGPVYMNKASDQEKAAATQNQAFTTQLQDQYKQEFGNSQQIQGSLNQQLQGIMNRGQAGQGFQPGEEANLRTDANEQAAHQQIQAQQAVNQQIGSRSEGSALTSGAVAQGALQNAAGAAATNAAAQRGITEQNAALARANVQQGMGGLMGLSGQEANQSGTVGSNANTSSNQSFNQVTQAYQPSNFWGQLAGGLAGGALNVATGGLSGLATTGMKALGNVFKPSGGGGLTDDQLY